MSEQRSLLGIHARTTSFGGGGDQQQLRQQNDDDVKELAAKTTRIAEITRTIADEVQTSTRIIDALGSDMTALRSDIGSSFRRLVQINDNPLASLGVLVGVVILIMVFVAFATRHSPADLLASDET